MKVFILLLFCFPLLVTGQVVIHDEPDTTGAHPVLVKQRVEATILQYMPLPFIHYSQDYNVGEDYAPDIISNHSYAWGNLVGGVNNYAKGILNVIAHGANVNIEITGRENNEPWVRVAAISPNGQNNNTSYGSGLDFVERTDDAPFICNVPCQSSATPKVTGKLYVIKHRVDSICACNTDWFNIYIRARETASNGGVFNSRTGYGVIDVNAAVSYSGSYPTNNWVDYEVDTSYYTSPVLAPIYADSFPRKTTLTGTELIKTYRNELNGYNSEFTTATLKSYVEQFTRHNVATGTTDGSGDLTVTFAAAMPDATYSLIATVEGTTSYTISVHTKATGTCKVRFFNPATGAAVTATSVTLSYEAKDY